MPGTVSPEGKISHITNREQQIIEGICQGLSNKEIARTLSVSEHTVKAHLMTIFKKFNVSKRSKVASLAMRSRRAIPA